MNYKSVMLGLVLTVITTLGFAKGSKFEFQLELLETPAFTMTVMETKQHLDVYLLDEEGRILYEGDVDAGEGFVQTFDLAGQRDGMYQLKVMDDLLIQVVTVVVRQGVVEMDLENSRHYYLPKENYKRGMSTVRVKSVTMDPMKTVIDNKTGRVVYSGRVKGSPYGIVLAPMAESVFVINSEGLITMKGIDI